MDKLNRDEEFYDCHGNPIQPLERVTLRTKHIQSIIKTTQRQDNRCEGFTHIFHLPKTNILRIDTTEADIVNLELDMNDE